MAINYNRMRELAERLISDNGQAVTLKKQATIDNGDGSVMQTVTEHQGSGVVSGFNTHDNAQFSEVQAGDAKLICTLPVLPHRGDKVTANGQEWSVVEVRDINPASLSVLFILQLRV